MKKETNLTVKSGQKVHRKNYRYPLIIKRSLAVLAEQVNHCYIYSTNYKLTKKRCGFYSL